MVPELVILMIFAVVFVGDVNSLGKTDKTDKNSVGGGGEKDF